MQRKIPCSLVAISRRDIQSIPTPPSAVRSHRHDTRARTGSLPHWRRRRGPTPPPEVAYNAKYSRILPRGSSAERDRRVPGSLTGWQAICDSPVSRGVFRSRVRADGSGGGELFWRIFQFYIGLFISFFAHSGVEGEELEGWCGGDAVGDGLAVRLWWRGWCG